MTNYPADIFNYSWSNRSPEYIGIPECECCGKELEAYQDSDGETGWTDYICKNEDCEVYNVHS